MRSTMSLSGAKKPSKPNNNKWVSSARELLIEKSKSKSFVSGCIFGSSARGNPNFNDVDVFITSTDPMGLPVRMGRIEIHSFLKREIDEVDRKFLYGVWRDENFRVGDLSAIENILKTFLEERGVKVNHMKIKKARFGIEDAHRHMEMGLESADPDEKDYHTREASEHAFHAMVVGTEELFVKYGYPIPSNHTERFNFLEEISTKQAKIENLKLKERLGKAFEVLHVKAYYHGTYDEEEVKERIKKAEEYIDDIEQLLN